MIRQIEKVFTIIDGIEYYNYKGIYDDGDNKWYSRDFIENAPVATSNVIKLLNEKHIDKLLDDSFVLNSNDPIHVVPDCKYSIKDIRNNYQIKRKFDDGVCNVYSPFDYSYSSASYINYTVVVKPKNTIIFLMKCNSKNEAITYAREYFSEHFSIDDLVVASDIHHIYTTKKFEPYIPLLLKTAQKPCVSYKKIQFNTNELTPDVLTIMRNVGCKNYCDTDAIENFLIQLAVLNQHNWRDYPLSVRAAFNTMNIRNTAMTYVFNHTSQYPKYVREMWDVWRGDIKSINQKDADMVRNYYTSILGLKNETMFVNEVTLKEKLEEAKINIYDFNKVFELTTRITPKKYDA